jgi:Na+/H+ antiporter NhaD/arsenite permease-like protein
LDGSRLSILLIVPFLAMLLSIAAIPLIAPAFWKKRYYAIPLFWSIVAVAWISIEQGAAISISSVIKILLEQYLPFFFVLFTLFTITGGIKIDGRLGGTPVLNTTLILIGSVLSSVIGTTGAAIVLLRPLLSSNELRKYKVHTIIFFIFLVGNIGGSLTPIGNPPLLMGFISNIDFFWPFFHMLLPTSFTIFLLLGIYYCIEWFLFRRENKTTLSREKGIILVQGWTNILFLCAAMSVVLLSKFSLGPALHFYAVEMPLAELLELVLLAVIALLSFILTKKEIRIENRFSWHPIIEVGIVFAGIFITITPIIAMLRAGSNGPCVFLFNSLTDIDGYPKNSMYYWISGLVSAFIDSAPAYLVFFNTASARCGNALSSAHFMMNENSATLVALTAGSSFMGALSYIGNAPNMIVRAIAEENGIKMPSFSGYMLWAFSILIPVFIIVQIIFIK